MSYPPSYTGPSSPEPAEVDSVRSMLHIARILAVLFGILILLAGIAYAALVAATAATCSAALGAAPCAPVGILLVFPILLIVWGAVNFLIYIEARAIEDLVNQREYEQAKSKTLVWMIVGFIFAGIVLGIVLLIAYIKFDPLVNRQRSAYASPPAAYGIPPPAPPPPPGIASPPNCPVCGAPSAYIAQYGRYYCARDQRYL